MLITRDSIAPNEVENLIIQNTNTQNQNQAYIIKYDSNNLVSSVTPICYNANTTNRSGDECFTVAYWQCNYPGHTTDGICTHGNWVGVSVCIDGQGGGGGSSGSGNHGAGGGAGYGGGGAGYNGSIITAPVAPDYTSISLTTTLSLTQAQQDWLNMGSQSIIRKELQIYLFNNLVDNPNGTNNAIAFANWAVTYLMANPSVAWSIFSPHFNNLDTYDYLNSYNFSSQSTTFVNQVISEIINTPINLLDSNVTLINGNLSNQITDMTAYLKCFDSTQPAIFTIYVDQPTANSNTPWSGNPISPNVGHTFISIKQGTIRRVLGFYPSSSVDLNAPAVTGICENNSAHEFDVSLSLNISASQLNSLISYIKIKSSSIYNLNTFNCTDFGMGAMSLAGIAIPSAYGTWGAPGVGSGAGDNPGQLGQNIRNMSVSSSIVKTTSTGNAQSSWCLSPFGR